MPLPTISPARPFVDIAAKVGIGMLLVLFVTGIAISPMAFSAVDSTNLDWNRLSDIGQAYGLVSALLSAVTLCLVILLQRHQLRHERISVVRDMHLNVVGMALDNPEYCQCWGVRVTEDDERLFYYTNMIHLLWWYSFEIGDLSEAQVRSYAGGMFDSEVPRDYWRMHGRWRLSGSRGRRRKFLLMIDEAFRAAEASGPPARRRERPHRTPQPGRTSHQARRLLSQPTVSRLRHRPR
ncbi:hypothetical protein Q0Z83_047330 [Actinoplanes sichuanensis]|uniref:DUF6082 family protein n=1 Tax=Actinoplanes sichuanensis TaxID=512349 RepID=A0ABW4AAG8_9ACTN|nr:DUF6082 family protein [Actinoplanes sichuanensis]BEL06542.1 hypothetical protein Q0Z83_047330 [Actinoplanes sichuanensis]